MEAGVRDWDVRAFSFQVVRIAANPQPLAQSFNGLYESRQITLLADSYKSPTSSEHRRNIGVGWIMNSSLRC